MPYILMHPLPPPRQNPCKPALPTFTTSTRAIAHFFHSRGWRAAHVSLGPSSPSSNTSPSTSRPATQDQQDQPNEATCYTSSGASSSALASCGPVVELHSYQLPLTPLMFHGPHATALQQRYLLYYAWPHTSFPVDAEGNLDLHLPNLQALEEQKNRDEEFWAAERKAERRRRRREEREVRRWVEERRRWETQMLGGGEESRGTLRITLKRGEMSSGSEVREEGGVEQKTAMLGRLRGARNGTVAPVVGTEDTVDCDLEDFNEEDEMDEGVARQWEEAERALLASGELEWGDGGRTLRQKKGFF